MDNHTVIAELRTEKGSSAAKRMRRGNKLPGIVYGPAGERMIKLDLAKLQQQLSHESFHSSVLDLRIGDESVPALLREVQSHPIDDNDLVHVDFQAIAADTAISVTVPAHYENYMESPGVKLNHGVFSGTEAELQIHCLPKNLPESITIDVSHLEINQSVHLSEVKAPEGVTFDALERGEDPSIATVLPPQKEEEVIVEDDVAAEAEAESDEADEVAESE